MDLAYWYARCLKKYAVFSGRARRREFWSFYVGNLFILVVICGFTFLMSERLGAVLFYVASVALFVPNIAVAVRRLHDIGRSGWWLFVQLLPLIGSIWLLVLLVRESDQGYNQYGDNPQLLHTRMHHTM